MNKNELGVDTIDVLAQEIRYLLQKYQLELIEIDDYPTALSDTCITKYALGRKDEEVKIYLNELMTEVLKENVMVVPYDTLHHSCY